LKTKHVIIVTGLSGAGKTTALNILEDMNYYTIDNLPLGLEKSLLDTEIEKLAVGIDIRTFKNTNDFFKFINYIKESGVKMDIIFIEAHEAIILGRYTLSRRAHPLKELTLLRSILKEKNILFKIREIADLIIDTTEIKTVELEKRFKKFLSGKDELNIDVNMNIHIQSFGYKYGVPIDSDLMFDVRFIPNPYYIEELKEKNGCDKEVKDYVLLQEESKEFYDKLLPLIEFLIPQYVKEGKKHLTISIGCSGGQHRSVTMKKNDKVIYVGKAKNLKNRVSSYFNRVHESEKTNELVKNIEDIEFFLTNTEIDALLLENNLIKKYSPKYNILLKDEKTYPFIKISKEDFPSIKIVRTTKALDIKSGEYFGPYPYGAWRLKNILMKLFKIRDCNRDMKKVSPRPCLKYYMKSCTGPCVYKDIKEEYNKDVENLKQVLRGNTSKLINELTVLMNKASQDMDFEKSIIYREQIKELKSIASSQIIQYERELDEDIFVFKTILDKAFICVLNMRDGKILGKSSTSIELKNKITDNIYEAIFMSYYSKHILPKSLVLDAEYENELSIVVEALTIEDSKKKEFHFPKIKSRRKDLLDMAYKNLERDIESYFSKKDTIEKGIKDLHDILGLKRFPRKIECFDISNIQGKDAVASMSVSIERRYSKLPDIEFPDVILIDGGLGQINSAAKVLEGFGKLHLSELLSLAERNEEIYKYGESTPYVLSKDMEALKIFQRVRDEAHRFGVTYHRKLRSKRIIASELDKIEGIGEVRRKKLLTKFGSISGIKKASIEELTEIIPEKVALEIKNKIK